MTANNQADKPLKLMIIDKSTQVVKWYKNYEE